MPLKDVAIKNINPPVVTTMMNLFQRSRNRFLSHPRIITVIALQIKGSGKIQNVLLFLNNSIKESYKQDVKGKKKLKIFFLDLDSCTSVCFCVFKTCCAAEAPPKTHDWHWSDSSECKWAHLCLTEHFEVCGKPQCDNLSINNLSNYYVFFQ